MNEGWMREIVHTSRRPACAIRQHPPPPPILMSHLQKVGGKGKRRRREERAFNLQLLSSTFQAEQQKEEVFEERERGQRDQGRESVHTVRGGERGCVSTNLQLLSTGQRDQG
jgi:hypothetical protein